MAFFDWNPELETRFPVVDEQHRFLVGLVNEFYDALHSGQAREMVGGVLGRLAEYAGSHFACEERLMVETSYPGFAAHKREHEALTSQVVKLLEEFHRTDQALSVKVGFFLRDWLMNHILKTDKAMGAYLATHHQLSA
ncbi:bacteriohemerythrin [Desulfuromonas carbonis]|uniref:bacteriohemerythrin n=1 Tax=Desulfuromonas sp. DDH964 TaxID=1823759 RepID=UPI00078CA1CA|nr:bacteriohemerythrin [Desulfuromonas sp. DDH964]AMV73740.1 hemerythrin family protein [Desulfuromonas sp. DDH964]